jgi:hypothetical protein
VVVTLHAACKMPSPLEICFSAQQLRFVVECRELYVAIESLPHGKYYGSHDLHTLCHYQLEELLSSFWILCLNQGFEIFEVLKDLGFLPEKVDPSKM